jgi:hypothetical protein
MFAGCAALQQQPQKVESKQTFTFDFAPKETAKVGSASMVLGLMKPYYAQSFTSGSGELFKSFQRALGNDFEELIVAKGFNLKGPYLSYDEMVFEDKKRTEMVIQIEISPEFTAAEGGWKTNVSILGPSYNSYSYEGTVSLVGKINISGYEPLTNEKIWAKSVQIPNIENIQITTSQKYARQLNAVEIMQDPNVYNALGKALQAQYTGIMEKINAHFSIEEFTDLKKEIKELKAKKGF